MSGDIDIFGLIMGASPVVKVVMAILVLASIVSWGIIIDRARATSRARKLSKSFEKKFWGGADIERLYKKSDEDRDGPLAAVFVAGFTEFIKLQDQAEIERDAVLGGSIRAMKVAMNRETESLERFLPMLATIGSTSPYIGLFGTVWGIMTSFHALGSVKQASLSMVAPGISEALIATAMGLFAAIPAVVAYNRYSNEVYRLEGRFDDFSEEFANILHRQM